jgi:mono/diheme cytochrome c family protein
MKVPSCGYRFSAGLLMLVLTVAIQPSTYANSPGDELARGADIFQTNCAACHGPDGGPDPDSALVKSLGVVPANFADALFNSREPLSDWKTVVTYGGPALGFSDKMPAFGESLSEDDIDAVLEYIKTLGGEHDYPDGSLNLFLPIRTKKAFPEDEWVWKQRYSGLEGDNVWKNTLEYEFRIGERWQGVLEVNHATSGRSGLGTAALPGFW